MEDIYAFLNRFNTEEQWAGAVLGAVVSAVFATVAGLTRFIQAFFYKRHLRNVLQNAINNKKNCAVVVRKMHSPNGTYKSLDPKFHPVQAVQEQTWINIEAVIGYDDIKGVSEVVNLFGLSGKWKKIFIKDISEAWSDWSNPVISVGGGYKTLQILDTCTPKLAELRQSGSFAMLSTGNEYFNNGIIDYGLGYKGHSNTGEVCFVLFGLGGMGSIIAAKFLQVNVKRFSRMYGKSGFAFIVRAKLKDGPENIEVAEIQPNPSCWRKFIYFGTYWKWRKYFKKPPRIN